MRILMLGWEFPPFISGGLGTACYGLTRALDRLGHRVLFVLPKAVDRSAASHVDLVSPDAAKIAGSEAGVVRLKAGEAVPPPGVRPEVLRAVRFMLEGFKNTEFLGVPAAVGGAYGARGPTPGREGTEVVLTSEEREALVAAGFELPDELRVLMEVGAADAPPPRLFAGADYGGDVVADAQRYARFVVRACGRERFDIIHAHDWMTYPAGMALARLTGRPLVAHIHSTEFDRSGEHVYQRVYDLERRGMHAAIRVVAVSVYTKEICVNRYGVNADKIDVVYNGIDHNGSWQPVPEQRVSPKDKIVLFLGRITMQKGPEYFIAAAQKVLEKIENVKFIVAGSGDMARRMIELAAEMGIGHKVLFTGFLRGKDVERVYKMADCYVMPSVSEPFGIAPLEAISHDVPVIISKQSGVSEVLTHALKVDFWDVNEMANKIIAVLKYPPLSQTLREHGAFEVRRLTWDGAAEKCVKVYRRATEAMRERVSVAV